MAYLMIPHIFESPANELLECRSQTKTPCVIGTRRRVIVAPKNPRSWKHTCSFSNGIADPWESFPEDTAPPTPG